MLDLSAEILEEFGYQVLQEKPPVLRNQDTITRLFQQQHEELKESIDGYLSKLYKVYVVGGCLLTAGACSLFGSSIAFSKSAPHSAIVMGASIGAEATGLVVCLGADKAYKCCYKDQEPSDEVKEVYNRVLSAYKDAKAYLHAGELSDKNKKKVVRLEKWYVTEENVIKSLTDIISERWKRSTPLLRWPNNDG